MSGVELQEPGERSSTAHTNKLAYLGRCRGKTSSSRRVEGNNFHCQQDGADSGVYLPVTLTTADPSFTRGSRH